MSLTNLNDDVLRVILEQIKTPEDLCHFAFTSHRIYDLAKSILIRCRYSTFRIPIRSYKSKHSLRLVDELLHLITDPTLAALVTRIETRTIDRESCQVLPWAFQKNVDPQVSVLQESVDTRINQLLTRIPPFEISTRLVIPELERALARLYAGDDKDAEDAWNVMRMTMISILFKVNPTIKELKIRAFWNVQQHWQMNEINKRLFPSHPPKITRLNLGDVSCRHMHRYPDAFHLFFVPSIQKIEINTLIEHHGQHNYFWPPSSTTLTCSAKELYLGFHVNLPRPTIVADLLRRCPSLHTFQMRRAPRYRILDQYDDDDDCDNSDEIIESMGAIFEHMRFPTNQTCWSREHPDLVGFDGYIGLISRLLSDDFDMEMYQFNTFPPCHNRLHTRFLKRVCDCVVFSITRVDGSV